MKSKVCRTCGLWLPASNFGIHEKNVLRADCRACRARAVREHNHLTGKKRPMNEAKDSPVWLGVHIAETVLSGYFDEVTKMPYGNPGFDFICKRGYKIDVKSACLSHGNSHFPLKSGRWTFAINKNALADYFLCLAFDNRDSLNPEHIWLFPGKEVSHLDALPIGKTEISLSKWRDFERPLDRVAACCNILRGGNEKKICV